MNDRERQALGELGTLTMVLLLRAVMPKLLPRSRSRAARRRRARKLTPSVTPNRRLRDLGEAEVVS